MGWWINESLPLKEFCHIPLPCVNFCHPPPLLMTLQSLGSQLPQRGLEIPGITPDLQMIEISSLV